MRTCAFCKHAESEHEDGAGCMWENSVTFPGWFCVCPQFQDDRQAAAQARGREGAGE